MNQKKNKKVIIILIIIIVVLILLTGGAIAYFSTDIFKTDKELFFKYISQITDDEKGLITQDIKQYLEKKNNTPYNNELKISFDFSDDNNSEIYKRVNDFTISSLGQVDTANSKVSQEINLNYSDNVNVPINYRKVGSIFGIQSKYLGAKFIAIDTDNLNNQTGSLSIVEDVKTPLDKAQNIEKIELSEEQRDAILNKYIDLINQQLSPEKFSKIQESNQTGYKLSLTGEEIKSVLTPILDNLKNDQETLDKINEYLKIQSNSSKITASDIDNITKDMQNDKDFDNKSVEITVYKENGLFNKISVKVDSIIINIEKNYGINQKDLKIDIINEGIQTISLNINFEGFQSMQNVKENYELELNFSEPTIRDTIDLDEDGIVTENTSDIKQVKTKYIIKNDINFTDMSDIESFTDQNSLILTSYDSEQVNEFLNKVVERVQQINKEQMEKIGLEENENPLLECISSLGIFTRSINIFSGATDVIGGSTSDMSELAVQTFNQKFEIYEDKNLSGQTTKGLLSTISLNNEDEENYKIKEINFNGEEYDTTEQNIVFIKEDIDLSKNYKVEFEKDENTGMIYRVIINVK